METNTSSSIKQLVIPIALIFGFARIVLDLIPKIAGAHSKVYYATFLIAFVFEIIVITYLIQKYKKQQQHKTLNFLGTQHHLKIFQIMESLQFIINL